MGTYSHQQRQDEAPLAPSKPPFIASELPPDDVVDILASHLTLREALSEITLSSEDRALLLRTGGSIVGSYRAALAAEDAYDTLDAALRPHNHYALFRASSSTEASMIVHLVTPRPAAPEPGSLFMPALLFVMTVLSVMYTGTAIAIGEIGLQNAQEAVRISQDLAANLWRGLPYALAILLILGGHELGHYLQLRRYRAASSLPYFLPAFGFSPLGTFGAAIVLKEPMRSRRMLFDVGAAGPWLGFVIAVPILLLGLATSSVVPVSDGLVEGNSVVYWLAKVLVFGQPLPNGEVDVLVNQLAWAGWTGLFVTALNLIPMGQLDGGHVLYSLFGERARQAYNPLMALIALGALFASSAWVILGLLAAFIGRFYAVPLDNVTPLDANRQRLARATLALFMLCLVPVPLAFRGMSDGLLAGMLATLSLSWGWAVLRKG
jgi:membrane-associated protease RseP (regulator of RpoE activity)